MRLPGPLLPGRLNELLNPGAEVWARPAAGPSRKTRDTLTLVKAATGELAAAPDADNVTAARAIDPKFAAALTEARDAGGRLLGYRCRVTLREAQITDPLPVFVA